jgi:hypothetical protein
MEPLLIVLIPGALGGVILAAFIARLRGKPPAVLVSRQLAAPSPAIINMAHIPVDGLGGLGLVAAVVAVAIADARIRMAMIVAAVLGTGVALVLIALRRRTAATSGTPDRDHRSVLHIDVTRPKT